MHTFVSQISTYLHYFYYTNINLSIDFHTRKWERNLRHDREMSKKKQQLILLHSWLRFTPNSLAASSADACSTLSMKLLSLIPSRFEIKSLSVLSASGFAFDGILANFPVRVVNFSYGLNLINPLGAASPVATGVTVGKEILS